MQSGSLRQSVRIEFGKDGSLTGWADSRAYKIVIEYLDNGDFRFIVAPRLDLGHSAPTQLTNRMEARAG